jgi:hypothetical protein
MEFIYTDPRKRRFWNAVLGCILLRKNFQNSVLAHSVTKIPLIIRHFIVSWKAERFRCMWV